ncbi:MAG TPA: HAD family hydrolase [Anaerolineae bacterium]|nr:HAD family hydrolase [Anaerolineae bacterium]HMR64392.1 HAD family hydrolase [Anaerolineae bacterium]
MTNLRGVILDVDGTLVDSNDAHALAWLEALEAEGYDVSFSRVRRLIGMGSDMLLPELLGLEKDSEQGQRLSQAHTEIFKARYLPRIKAFDLVPALLGRMADSGLTLVVASSAHEEELEALLSLAGATDYVQARTSSDDAERSKPRPDIVRVALAKLGYAPAEVLMLADTPYDIEAAQPLGVPVIAVRCGGWDDFHLRGAIAIYDNPADLLAHYDQSPLAQREGLPVEE